MRHGYRCVSCRAYCSSCGTIVRLCRYTEPSQCKEALRSLKISPNGINCSKQPIGKTVICISVEELLSKPTDIFLCVSNNLTCMLANDSYTQQPESTCGDLYWTWHYSEMFSDDLDTVSFRDTLTVYRTAHDFKQLTEYGKRISFLFKLLGIIVLYHWSSGFQYQCPIAVDMPVLLCCSLPKVGTLSVTLSQRVPISSK